MKIEVNKEKCLICGMCVSMNNEVFVFDDNGEVNAKNENISEENIEAIKEIKDSCPAGAIEEEVEVKE